MKGQKTGGRTKGTPNVVTQELRERFKEFADGNFDKIQKWLDRTAEDDPAEALKIYLSLTERIIGKVSSTNIDLTSKGESIVKPTIILDSKVIPETD
jgi:hypothetical protein